MYLPFKSACFKMRSPPEKVSYLDMLEYYKGKRIVVKMKQCKYKYEGVLISDNTFHDVHLEDVKKISRKKVIDELDEVIISTSATLYITQAKEDTIKKKSAEK